MCIPQEPFWLCSSLEIAIGIGLRLLCEVMWMRLMFGMVLTYLAINTTTELED